MSVMVRATAESIDKVMATFKNNPAWRAATRARVAEEQRVMAINEQAQQGHAFSTESDPEGEAALATARFNEQEARRGAMAAVTPDFKALHTDAANEVSAALASAVGAVAALRDLEAAGRAIGMVFTPLVVSSLPDETALLEFGARARAAGVVVG